MIDLVYRALKQRIQEEVQPNYVDWYMGQYLESEEEGGGQLLWATPAVFIEFQPVQWKTLANSVQCADLTFALHLVTDNIHDDDRRVTDGAVSPFPMSTSIYAKMMNWRCNLSYLPEFVALAGSNADPVLLESIVRVQSDTDHTLRRQMLALQAFQCKVYDYSAQKQWVDVLATLDLDIQKVNKL